MEISLRPDLEQFVDDRVRAGQFKNPSDVITQALETLKCQQEGWPCGDDLARLIAQGQAEADRGELLGGEEVFDKILTRNAARRR